VAAHGARTTPTPPTCSCALGLVGRKDFATVSSDPLVITRSEQAGENLQQMHDMHACMPPQGGGAARRSRERVGAAAHAKLGTTAPLPHLHQGWWAEDVFAAPRLALLCYATGPEAALKLR
jgi:hypothetical protein